MKKVMLMMLMLSLAAAVQADFTINGPVEAMTNGWMNGGPPNGAYNGAAQANLRTTFTGTDAGGDRKAILQTNLQDTGNREANTYWETTANMFLPGAVLTFNYAVLSNELSAHGYTCRAFISEFSAGWATTQKITKNLATLGDGTVSLTVITGSHIQFGFMVSGPADTAGSATADLSVIVGQKESVPSVTPTISFVSPTQPVTTGSVQPFTIIGTNFISTATVDLEDVTTSEPFHNRAVSLRSDSTWITINPNFGAATVNHSWRVRVNNGSIPSTWFNFTVVPNTLAPVVRNVTASQRTDGSGIVDISYTLSDADNNRCAITVLASSNGGSTWTITPSPSALSGDLTNVLPGSRHITWASKTDLPGTFGDNYRIKVTADDGQTQSGMVAILGGTFSMGNSFPGEGYSDELPVHTVTLDSFYMGKYDITNGQYCAYLNSALSQGLITVTSGVVYQAGSGTSYRYCDTSTSSTYSQIANSGSIFIVRTKGGRDMSNAPMVCVSWYGSVAYCNWRSQQEGKEQCYNLSTWACDFNKHGYRLATEAEWEYAARGGLSGKRFPWGDTITHSQANYNSSSSYSYDISPTRGYHPTWNDGVYPCTSPVGSFAANGYGLCDMAGNVWEWCNDWYSGTYYNSSPTNNPTGPTSGNYRVLRGGDWGVNAHICRVAYRDSDYNPFYWYDSIGFRLVLDLN